MLEVIDTFCVSNKDNTRKQVNNEDTSSKAMLAIDGVGFNWSDMVEEHVQTNITLMTFLDSEYDDLIVKLNQTEFTAATYKRGLATVEEQLVIYKKNEVIFSEEVVVLKRDVACKDYEINVLKKQVSEDTSSFVESPLNVNKETAFSVDKKIEFVKLKDHDKPVRKSVRTLIEAARTMLADSKLPTTFWAEAVSTACYVQNRVLIVKPHNKTPYELFRGFKPTLSFMRPFGCHVTIFNTFDNLGKFDGKSDERFFVGYSLSSKAFRVYNTRTRKVEENLHIGFLENNPMIEGNGPKWLFDIDSLTQSKNYVPVAPGTISYESTGIQGDLNIGTSLGKEATSQDYIMMPIWKDASYFDTPSKDVEDGTHNEDDDKYKSEDDYSPKEVNDVGKHVNTASLDVNISHFKLNTVDISNLTLLIYHLIASSSDLHLDRSLTYTDL
nr:ribonuclease H-like domain-containing protein [Tanacetum cinerariifolium]